MDNMEDKARDEWRASILKTDWVQAYVTEQIGLALQDII